MRVEGGLDILCGSADNQDLTVGQSPYLFEQEDVRRLVDRQRETISYPEKGQDIVSFEEFPRQDFHYFRIRQSWRYPRKRHAVGASQRLHHVLFLAEIELTKHLA